MLKRAKQESLWSLDTIVWKEHLLPGLKSFVDVRWAQEKNSFQECWPHLIQSICAHTQWAWNIWWHHWRILLNHCKYLAISDWQLKHSQNLFHFSDGLASQHHGVKNQAVCIQSLGGRYFCIRSDEPIFSFRTSTEFYREFCHNLLPKFNWTYQIVLVPNWTG